MAKSLRSKWRRKCRAVKRIRYGQKELERLKKMLGVMSVPESQAEAVGGPQECTVSTESIETPTEPTELNEEEEQTEAVMQVGKRTYNLKTMKDQNGCYPVWMHPRKIRKQKRLQKTKKKKKH